LLLKACVLSAIDSETLIGLQLKLPSDATTCLILFYAIVVIGLDCQAERDLGIDGWSGSAPIAWSSVAPIAFFFTPAAVTQRGVASFVFMPAAVLAPVMPHIP
jgi:hypothetical protein